MNFTYYKFSFLGALKKKSLWFTWLLYMFMIVVFIVLLPYLANINVLQVWSNSTMPICQTFIIVTIALFCSVLAINIFRDSNDEGTELIVISKPISRKKIVFTKFFVFATYCLIASLTSCIFAAITPCLPQMEMKFYSGLVVSMLIGNVVCFFLSGSISILLSVKLAKTAVILVNVLVVIVLFVYQAVGLFAIKTPILKMADDNVGAIGYNLTDRKDDGSYDEKQVAWFGIAALDQPTPYLEKATTWEDVKNYWQYVKDSDPSTAVNSTDIMSQLGLSYSSYNLQDYSTRQARRIFAISRCYDYELTHPASPELTGPEVQGKDQIKWIYSSGTEYKFKDFGVEIEGSIKLPGSYSFLATTSSDYPIISGEAKDTFPIGYYYWPGEAWRQHVYFEKDLWNKYSAGFTEMFNTIFDYTLKGIDGNDYYLKDKIQRPFDYLSAWCMNTDNLNNYYKLVWACFTGNAPSYIQKGSSLQYQNRNYYDIKTIRDINERFIQFKYFIFHLLRQFQLDVLSGKIPCDPEEQAQKEKIISTYLHFVEPFVGVEFSNSDWYMRDKITDITLFKLLTKNSKAPAYWLMDWITDGIGDIEPLPWDKAIISTRAKIYLIHRIYTNCISTREKFSFNSFTEPSREDGWDAGVYCVTGKWMPQSLAELIHQGQNMSLIYYNTNKKFEFWYAAVFWFGISIALFSCGIVIYNRYDVK